MNKTRFTCLLNMIFIGVAVVAACCCQPALAITFQWTNPNGGSFNSPANWNPVGTPGIEDNALFEVDSTFFIDFNAPQLSNNLVVLGGNPIFRPINSTTYEVGNTTTLEGGILGVQGGSNGETLEFENRSLTVGNTNRGNLEIRNRGIVNSRISSIGNFAPNGTGQVLVRDAGSTWNVSGTLAVGNFGAGSLLVEVGGRVLGDVESLIAAEPGSGGQAIVRGAGSRWEAGLLTVGAEGDGRLTVQDGGSVANGDGRIAFNAGSTGEATVDGPDSIWNSSISLLVGVLGDGRLTVQGGGSVTSGFSSVGDGAGSGLAFVDGPDSTWSVTADLVVGRGRSGALFVTGGGAVDVEGETRLRENGRLALQGGTLSTGSLAVLGGDFDFDSGTLNITGDQGVTLGAGELPFSDNTVVLSATQSLGVSHRLTIPGGTQLFTTGGDLITGSAAIETGGQLFLSGGRHDFGTALTNHGSAVFNNTTLDSPVTSPAASDITVLGVVTFNELVSGGAGIFGPGTAIFNGGHSPGDSPAVVPVEGSLVYGASNMLTIELEGLLTGEFDRLEVQGDVFLDGDLTVDLLSGFTPNVGEQFEVIDVGGTLHGQFGGLDEGAIFQPSSGIPLRINYSGGDGNDVVFTAVPEPATWLLISLGLPGVSLLQRRRTGFTRI